MFGTLRRADKVVLENAEIVLFSSPQDGFDGKLKCAEHGEISPGCFVLSIEDGRELNIEFPRPLCFQEEWVAGTEPMGSAGTWYPFRKRRLKEDPTW